MKKILVLLLIIIMCFYFVSCNYETVSPSTSNHAINSTSAPVSYEENYRLGNESFDKKNYVDAINYFNKSNFFKDSANKIKKSQQLIDEMKSRASIAYPTLSSAVGYIDENCTFKYFGNSEKFKNVNLSNVAQIACSGSYLVGVLKDGTVRVFFIDFSDFRDSFKSEAIERANAWTNIKQVVIEGRSIFGLKNNGTIVSSVDDGIDTVAYQPEFEKAETWKNIAFFKGSYSYGLQAITNDKKPIGTKYNDNYNSISTVVDMDVGGFIVIVTPDKIVSRGLLFTDISGVPVAGIIDVAVGSDFAAFLYDTGHIKIWNTDNEIIDIDDVDNVFAIDADINNLFAFKTDGTIHLFDCDSKIESGGKVIVHHLHIVSGDHASPQNYTQQKPQKKDPCIGMTKNEVLNSTWGEPEKKNITETAYSTSEQWVYPNYQYIYFRNGVVTSIQRSE